MVLKFVGKDTVNKLSDEIGNFSVQLPVGKYNLETSHIGYTPFTLYNINLTSGNAQILQIELDEKSQELRVMVIKAGKSVSFGYDYTFGYLKINSRRNKIQPWWKF